MSRVVRKRRFAAFIIRCARGLKSRATAEVADGARRQLDQQIQFLTTESENLQRQVELAKRRMTDEMDDQDYEARRTSFVEKSSDLEKVGAERTACR